MSSVKTPRVLAAINADAAEFRGLNDGFACQSARRLCRFGPRG